MTREWFTIDKTAWGPGPWQDEPDKIQWVDRASDLDCLMVRNHGGLTFAGACDESAAEGTGICHVPEPGRPDHVWWLGFDCAHGGDISPALAARYPELFHGSYRERAYVAAEVTQLAAQLAGGVRA